MKKYKITFPTGYLNGYGKMCNMFDYNEILDVHIVFEGGDIYYATLVTAEQIRDYYDKTKEIYYWMEDMLVIKDFEKETIRKIIKEIVDEGYYERIFCKIGVVGDENNDFYSYEELIEMNDYI